MIRELGQTAKEAAKSLASAPTEQKNGALTALLDTLKRNEREILQANAEDIAEARKARLEESLIDRLSLQGRLGAILSDLEKVIDLPDPIGEIFFQETLKNGLEVTKQRTPIGVLGVIYESRPNVTIDVTALALKSGNCALLRGGSETLRTNIALLHAIREALKSVNLPDKAIQLVEKSDRSLVKELLELYDSIDLIIPRGGAALHRFCRENSKIPVITGGIGICHLFVDETADLARSLQVILNAKVQRPTVCNALDTLLVHERVAHFIPEVVNLLQKSGVTFSLDKRAYSLVKNPSCKIAESEDWDTEWLRLHLGIKIVKNLDEAIKHIQKHSTGHSDGILTEDDSQAASFVNSIDSAAVYVNASTRFTDGSELGLGSEVAISTQKIHARGPMGLQELTSYKWVVRGDYAVRG